MKQLYEVHVKCYYKLAVRIQSLCIDFFHRVHILSINKPDHVHIDILQM